MGKPLNLNANTHRLTSLPGIVAPDQCQRCGSLFQLSRWQEHDHEDLPEHKLIVLCKKCSDEVIEQHPRLYHALVQHEPWPGCMDICMDCKWRSGVSCANPKAKANGGEGVYIKFPQPSIAFVDGYKNGRRWGGQMKFYSGPPTACREKEAT